ncbi:hypothetical protein AALP_AA6G131200 [Arabis alpina]|uniref:ADP-ribosyl cyclase/cyclic ADP-ribose hydrolase n=1 Tax=Arabis alpina TaxID=50452 RepID=A0A087GNY1_ARAAL|nr:hypothetical protein AALP_AA6G131200 [Arabis alpina]
MAMTTTTSDSTVEPPPIQLGPQVFINFRGADLRNNFISFLRGEFTKSHINYYIDCDELRSENIDILFDQIRKSQIALVFFSEQYANSDCCLDELVEIMKNVKAGKLRVIPIFFNVKPDDVQEQKNAFGAMLYGKGRRKIDKMPQWEDALEAVPSIMGCVLGEESSQYDFLVDLIKKVKKVEEKVLSERAIGERSSMLTSSGDSSSVTTIHHLRPPLPPYGMAQRLEQLQERLDFGSDVTQIVKIVGMSGIGKTTLAEMHFDKCGKRFTFRKIFLGIRDKPKNEDELSWLETELLNGKKGYEADMFKKKSFLVLDDVSDKKQIKFLLDNLPRIKKGSKIVITTRDKSCLEEVPGDTYVVPRLNENEALQLLHYHAVNNQDYTPPQNFIELSQKFLDYAGGNPRALEELGKELCGKDEAHWRKELPHCCNDNIKRAFRISYDELTDPQKDAFLDIACFFRSEDEDFVTSLLASNDSHESIGAAREVRDLANKFLISFSAGQIKMPDILCSLGKELGLIASVNDNLGKSRMWKHNKVVSVLMNNKEKDSTVRGILLDVSQLEEEIAIATDKLTLMPNLRYLNFFDSRCPKQCKVVDADECKVYVPDELEFPSKEIRYFHWLKFPLPELPSDFNPGNLIDLRLPYSKIERIWKVVKDTPNLKWVDLSHSTELVDLSALCQAKSLQRLNLEVASPLAVLRPAEQVPSSFIFTNCGKLEHLAKNEITCYGHNKSRLLSETLNRHNKGLSFEALVATCFPGSEVPAWFGHKASGPVLEPELPRHWSESGFVGIALCAIVSFKEQKIKNNNLQVKCICDFNNVKTSSSYFNCPVGGLSETGDEQRTIKSTHVFIGYTNWLNIKKCQEEDGKKGCVPTKASIKFQVTDDIGEVKNCEVLKCGFSLVYEYGSWDASSRTDDVEPGEVESLATIKKVSKTTIANCGASTMRDDKVNGEASCSSTKS